MTPLAADTAMGTVHLLVRDLPRMVAFYTEGVGLDVLEDRGETVVLGRGVPDVEPILRLERNANLPAFHRRDAGLFHTAILFNSWAALARSVASTANHDPASFTGSSDHLVSQAFYFDDPEGNGLELYADRPRDQWVSADGGQIKMATLPLDPNAFLRQHLAPATTPVDGANVGHVHLQVGSIPEAEAFYSRVLGFDVMARYGTQALFLAAGGYHHHLGLNTWNSGGAGPRAASLGLERVQIEVPSRGDLDPMLAALKQAGIEANLRSDEGAAGTTLHTRDPWGTALEIRAR